jgi:hypothetical protein
MNKPTPTPTPTAEDGGGATTATDGGGAKATVATPPAKDAGPPIINRMPANPKGSHYDAGKKKPPDTGL